MYTGIDDILCLNHTHVCIYIVIFIIIIIINTKKYF